MVSVLQIETTVHGGGDLIRSNDGRRFFIGSARQKYGACSGYWGEWLTSTRVIDR